MDNSSKKRVREDPTSHKGTSLHSENILGYRVVTASLAECVDYLASRIVITADAGSNKAIHTGRAAGNTGVVDVAGRIVTAGKPLWLACINPHSVRMAMADPAAEDALRTVDMLIPDGIGIVLASRILGGSIRERITGSDIFRELSHRLNVRGNASYFFLGSTVGTLEAIKSRLVREYPKIRFAGGYSPPFAEIFSDDENRAMLEAINATQPDVLWVGMTAPKQEKWIYQNKEELNVKFIGAVGAVFDFYAGNVKRSHPWFLDHGLEWLPRLLQEPRRLWQRTFVSAPVFFWQVLCQRWRKASQKCRHGGFAF